MQSTTRVIRADTPHGHRSGVGDPAVDESRLIQREQVIALQEQCVGRYFDEQQRLLRTEENRIDRQSAVLAREKSRFVQEHQERLRVLEKSAENARLERHRLEIERQQLRQEQESLENSRAAGIEENARRRDERIREISDVNPQWPGWELTTAGDVELARRQLESSWRELRQTELAARDRRKSEEREIQEQWKAIELERGRLRQMECAWEDEHDRSHALHQHRLEELEGIEVRIRNYHIKLRTLREEAARWETELSAAGLAQAVPERAEGSAGSKEPEPVLAHPRFQGDLHRFLAGVIEDLADQCRCLAEQQAAIARIKRAWQWEWDAALTELADRNQELSERETTLAPREHSLSLAERLVQRRDADLSRQQQRFQCWEARLFQQESTVRFQRRRLLAFIKARNAAVREQQRILQELRTHWESDWSLRIKQAQQARTKSEITRRDYFRLREMYRERLAELETRHRLLMERELILRQSQQQYLTEQPDAVNAEQELDRRHRHWAKLAAKPIQGLHKHRIELEKRTAHLEAFRQYLIKSQRRQESEEAQVVRLRCDLQTERTEMEIERLRWLKELQAWREERDRLMEHNKDLKDQIERLVLALADGKPPDPPVAQVA